MTKTRLRICSLRIHTTTCCSLPTRGALRLGVDLPQAVRTGKGLPFVNVLNLGARETVTALVLVENFQDAKYISLLTTQGRIKRLELSEFAAVRANGIIATTLIRAMS